MKLLLAGVAALAVMAGARLGSDAPTTSIDPLTTAATGQEPAAASSARRYTLFVAGRDDGCVLLKGRTGADGAAAVQSAARCTAYPDITEARVWQQDAQGTLTLAGAGGRPLLKLMPGDGVAFESYRDGAPLVSMVAD